MSSPDAQSFTRLKYPVEGKRVPSERKNIRDCRSSEIADPEPFFGFTAAETQGAAKKRAEEIPPGGKKESLGRFLVSK